MEDGTCRLCGKSRPLCKSHVIPDAFYRHIYDEVTHKFCLLSSDPDEHNKRPSSGFWEYLLCEVCERQLGDYDNYGKSLVEGAIAHGNITDNILRVFGEDYSRIKLFQLSVLWRASISSLEFFAAVSLGPHEEKIRRMLLDQNPGEREDYPCLMALLEDDVLIHAPVPGALRPPNPTHLMLNPLRGRMESGTVYRFCYAGFGWIYWIGSAKPPKIVLECAARRGGPLLVRKCHLSVFFGREQIRAFGDAGKLGASFRSYRMKPEI